MLPCSNTRGIPCCAASSWMLRWPHHQQTFLDLWVGGALSHQKKSLEAQHLASPPVPFVAANEAGLHYSGPGAGCDAHQQSAPIREMQEEQHMGSNAAQTDKQPISEQKPLPQEGPCRFAPR